MILIKSQLSKKDKKIVESILSELVDIYGDFYITQNNLRLPIRENLNLLYKLLREGDKIIFEEDGESIAVILGYAEKSSRKYLRILSKNNKTLDKLLKGIDWNITDDIYCKIKKKNYTKEILLKNKYKFIGNRGSEVLLVKQGVNYNGNTRK